MKANLPDFIHIGPGRSGTTYLYEVLKAHPGIYMAKGTKETNFFSFFYDKGLDWYKNFFPAEANDLVKGEISNRYFYTSECAGRIRGDIPGIKLITVLRNPYERMVSVYNSLRQRGEIEHGLSFSEALNQHPEILRQNRVGDHLENYLSRFEQRQVMVLFYDDLLTDARGFVRYIYDFLEVDPSFKPDFLDEKINPSQDLRLLLVRGIIRKGADLLRSFGMLSLLHRIKQSRLVNSLLFKGRDSKEEDSLEYVYKEYSGLINQQIVKVEKLTGRSLDHWKRN